METLIWRAIYKVADGAWGAHEWPIMKGGMFTPVSDMLSAQHKMAVLRCTRVASNEGAHDYSTNSCAIRPN